MKFKLGEVLRKWTTPVHWAQGVLCGIIATQYFPAGMLLLGVSAGNQIWNDWQDMKRDPGHLPEGCADWWEAFLTFCITMAVAVILHLADVITIVWI